MYPKGITFSLLTLVSVPIFAAPINPCAATFHFSYKSGDVVEGEHSPLPGVVTRRLGAGNVGTVYRLDHPPEHLGPEVKIYQDVKRGWDRDIGAFAVVVNAADSQKKDTELFRLYAAHPQEAFDIPTIEEAQIDGRPAIIFKSAIYGKSVFDIARDETIDISLRYKIVGDYERRLAQFRQYLVDTFAGVGTITSDPNSTDAHVLPYLEMKVEYSRPNDGGSVYTHVHVASDGVIVSALDLRQELRDPN